MRVQWKDWEGWLHRFAGLHIVHLEKKNCKELLGQQTLTTNSVRTLSLDI